MRSQYKTEKAWAMFNYGILLPFTIRSTRRQCLQDFAPDRTPTDAPDAFVCRKVAISCRRVEATRRKP